MKWIISLLSTKVMFEHNLSDSRRWHELKTSRQLRTERLKDHRTINVRVEFQSLPLPAISLQSAEVAAPKRDSKSVTYEDRTNLRSAEVWRPTDRKREFWAPAGAPRCGGLRARTVAIGLLCAPEPQGRVLVSERLAERESFERAVRSTRKMIHRHPTPGLPPHALAVSSFLGALRCGIGGVGARHWKQSQPQEQSSSQAEAHWSSSWFEEHHHCKFKNCDLGMPAIIGVPSALKVGRRKLVALGLAEGEDLPANPLRFLQDISIR